MASNDLAVELAGRVDTLFREDTVGAMSGVSKKIQQEIKLLNKTSKPSATVAELNLLQKAISKVGKPSTSVKKPVNGQVRDVWADEPSEKRRKSLLPGTITRRESFAPAVVPAASAFSVNPSKEDLDAMMIAEADKEIARLDAIKTYRAKRLAVLEEAKLMGTLPVEPVEAAPEKGLMDRKSKAQKLKETKHKQMLREHELKRKEKETRKARQNKTAIQALEEEQAARREQRLKVKVGRIVAEAAGKFTLARGAGGRIMEAEEAVPTTIAASLRRMVPMGDPVLERRASLLKRRMIEQIPEMNAEYKEKLRFAKLDARKSHKMTDRDAMSRCVLLA